MSAAATPLPELIDVRGIQEEMGVKRTVAERIIEQIPKQEIPGVRRPGRAYDNRLDKRVLRLSGVAFRVCGAAPVRPA